jgi:RecJ-like exonuclease
MKDTKYLEELLAELKIIMIRKHQDYGPYNIAHAPGGALNGLLVRMHDKMERLEHLYFHRKTDTPNYESVEDTLKDLANYAIIGLMVQRGQWEGIGGSKISE